MFLSDVLIFSIVIVDQSVCGYDLNQKHMGTIGMNFDLPSSGFTFEQKLHTQLFCFNEKKIWNFFFIYFICFWFKSTKTYITLIYKLHNYYDLLLRLLNIRSYLWNRSCATQNLLYIENLLKKKCFFCLWMWCIAI